MKSLIGIICILGMIGLVIGIEVLADTDTGTVTATVTAEKVSVAVEDGVVAWGSMARSSQGNTLGTDQQHAGNNGTVTADFDIASTDATGGTQWTLAASTGSIDDFIHKFSTDTGANWITFPLDESYDALAYSVTATATKDFDLFIGIPSSVSDTNQKTITVTVLATGQ